MSAFFLSIAGKKDVFTAVSVVVKRKEVKGQYGSQQFNQSTNMVKLETRPVVSLYLDELPD